MQCAARHDLFVLCQVVLLNLLCVLVARRGDAVDLRLDDQYLVDDLGGSVHHIDARGPLHPGARLDHVAQGIDVWHIKVNGKLGDQRRSAVEDLLEDVQDAAVDWQRQHEVARERLPEGVLERATDLDRVRLFNVCALPEVELERRVELELVSQLLVRDARSDRLVCPLYGRGGGFGCSDARALALAVLYRVSQLADLGEGICPTGLAASIQDALCDVLDIVLERRV